MRQALIVLFLFCQILTYSQVKSKLYNALLKTLLSHSVPELSVQQAEDSLDHFILLDAREETEFAISRIPGARLVGMTILKLLM